MCIRDRMENARKYTQQGGKISVYAEENENYVEISIQDNGLGLSVEDKERILSEKVYDSGKIGLQSTETVSYTHLDVYKRQE